MGDSHDWSDLHKRQRAFEEAREPAERIALLRSMAASVPRDAHIHYELALALSRTGDADGEAIQEFRRALSLDPNHARSHLGLGVIYHRRGEYELAEASYAAALRVDPRLFRAWLNLGALGLARRDYRRARRAYAEAVRLRPEEIAARQGLARALQGLGRPSDALVEWQAAYELDPSDPTTLRGLAKTLGRLRDERARAFYERAIEANPTSVSLRTELAALLVEAGEVAEAEAVLRRGIGSVPGSAALCQALAMLLQDQGRRDEAITVLREGLVRTTEEERLRMALVRALIGEERLADAIRELRQVVLADPRNAESRRVMAALLACEGRAEEARTTAIAALRLDRSEPSPRLLLMSVPSRPQYPMAVAVDDEHNTPPSHRAYALAVRGVLQLALRNTQEAARLFDLAAKALPETALPRVGRAVVYMATGDLDAAHAELRTCAILEPTDPHVQHLLGETAFHLGHYEEASQAFQAALADEKVEDFIRAHSFYCRARAFRKRGLTRDAIESYKQAETLDPEYSPSFFGCAKALQEIGRIEEALRHYQRCVALSSRHAKALQGMASCLAALGRAPEAVEAYRAAIKADPNHAPPRYHLAVLLERTGDPAELVSLLRAYLKAEPRGPYAEDARRRLRMAELRLTGALAPHEPLPAPDQDSPFVDTSQDSALFGIGTGPYPSDPRLPL